MNIMEILKDKKEIFLIDEIETKKMKTLIENVNDCLEEILNEIDDFNQYKNEQLKGETHTKIVMAKSLLNQYPEWIAVKEAFNKVKSEEEIKEKEFYNIKNKLIDSFKNLLNETKKSPLVCKYDLFGNDYQLCDQGHEIIILGDRNAFVIENMINILEDTLNAKGLFDEIGSVQLQANYVSVNQNADLCLDKINNGEIKASKIDKLKVALDDMIDIGKQVVIFSTYKQCLSDIGVKGKEIQLMEKQFIKKYVPLKKYLQKEFDVKFADICDVVVNEETFAMFGEK